MVVSPRRAIPTARLWVNVKFDRCTEAHQLFDAEVQVGPWLDGLHSLAAQDARTNARAALAWAFMHS